SDVCSSDLYRRAGGPEQPKRGHSVATGERVIGEHHVGRELAQRVGERIAGVDDSCDGWESGALEFVLDQLGVSRPAFEQQDAERTVAHVARTVPHAATHAYQGLPDGAARPGACRAG